MKNQIITVAVSLLFGVLFSQNAQAQIPEIEWQKRHGGTYTDGFNAVVQTKDGGYIAVGIFNVGNYNFGIQKMDANGDSVWNKNYGGSFQDIATSVIQLSDGNYIVGGKAAGNNGDVSGNHGMDDASILKLDNSGNIIWKKCFGGSSSDNVSKLLQLSDGNFLALGTTSSDDGDLTGINTVGFFGESNIWLMKLDTAGNILWQKTYGGLSHDAGYDLIAMPDGGFAIAGTEATQFGSYDIFVSRIDSLGNELWKKVFGYGDYDRAYTLIATDKNDLIIGGITLSTDFPEYNGGGTDAIIAKLDGINGDVIWHKAIGGSLAEWFTGITKYNDWYILAGTSASSDGDISSPLGSWDVWLVAIDEDGNIQWDKSYGGSAEEAGSAYNACIVPTADNGLVVASMTVSPEISGGGGSWDGYIFKLKDNSMSIDDKNLSDISIYPNPTNDYLFINIKDNETYNYKLMDVSGKVIESGVFKPADMTINLQLLPGGTYFLELQQDGKVKGCTKRFLKL